MYKPQSPQNEKEKRFYENVEISSIYLEKKWKLKNNKLLTFEAL